MNKVLIVMLALLSAGCAAVVAEPALYVQGYETIQVADVQCTIDASIDAVCRIFRNGESVMSMECITRDGYKFVTTLPTGEV